MKARFLRRDERSYAQSIFGKTIPLDDILVTDAAGASVKPIEPFDSPDRGSKYSLAVGPDGFTSCMTAMVRSLFVHQLTQVWQRRFTPAKWRPSCDDGAANYQVGQPWRQYTAEQQAKLVADWANAGMRLSDPRTPYISNHIRIGAA
jgi:hypothetical protein